MKLRIVIKVVLIFSFLPLLSNCGGGADVSSPILSSKDQPFQIARSDIYQEARSYEMLKNFSAKLESEIRKSGLKVKEDESEIPDIEKNIYSKFVELREKRPNWDLESLIVEINGERPSNPHKEDIPWREEYYAQQKTKLVRNIEVELVNWSDGLNNWIARYSESCQREKEKLKSKQFTLSARVQEGQEFLERWKKECAGKEITKNKGTCSESYRDKWGTGSFGVINATEYVDKAVHSLEECESLKNEEISLLEKVQDSVDLDRLPDFLESMVMAIDKGGRDDLNELAQKYPELVKLIEVSKQGNPADYWFEKSLDDRSGEFADYWRLYDSVRARDPLEELKEKSLNWETEGAGFRYDQQSIVLRNLYDENIELDDILFVTRQVVDVLHECEEIVDGVAPRDREILETLPGGICGGGVSYLLFDLNDPVDSKIEKLTMFSVSSVD
jgi:hypothetical protein